MATYRGFEVIDAPACARKRVFALRESQICDLGNVLKSLSDFSIQHDRQETQHHKQDTAI